MKTDDKYSKQTVIKGSLDDLARMYQPSEESLADMAEIDRLYARIADRRDLAFVRMISVGVIPGEESLTMQAVTPGSSTAEIMLKMSEVLRDRGLEAAEKLGIPADVPENMVPLVQGMLSMKTEAEADAMFEHLGVSKEEFLDKWKPKHIARREAMSREFNVPEGNQDEG